MSRHATGRPPGRPPGSGHLGKVKRVTVHLPESLYVRLAAYGGRSQLCAWGEVPCLPPVCVKPLTIISSAHRKDRRSPRLLLLPLPRQRLHRAPGSSA